MITARNDSSGVAPRPPAGQQHLPGAGGTSGLPQHGWSPQETLSRLEALRDRDVRWKDGRVFSLAYYASPEAHELATEAYRRFSGENALNVDAFPSLRTMQADVLAIVAGWLHAPASARGFFTSGGTESILMAVKAARDQFRQAPGDQFRHDDTRGSAADAVRRPRTVTRPNVVLPTSAHAAFEKAGAYFDVEMRRVAVRADWRADATRWLLRPTTTRSCSLPLPRSIRRAWSTLLPRLRRLPQRAARTATLTRAWAVSRFPTSPDSAWNCRSGTSQSTESLR